MAAAVLMKPDGNIEFKQEPIVDKSGFVEGLSLSWPRFKKLNFVPRRNSVLVFILPGMTGCHDDAYIHEIVYKCADSGLKSVVYNYKLISEALEFKS
jgi:hypothetical protein